MANVAPRILRNVSVDRIRLSLARFERDLCASLGEPLRADLGEPGAGHYLSTGEPRRDLSAYLLSEFASKLDDGKNDASKERTSLEKFREAERLCFETNQRLAVSGFTGQFEQAMVLARKVAAKILGRFDWDVAAEGFGWGPGASTRLPRTKSDAAYKYSGTPETTIGNAILADAAIRHVPSWKQELDKLTPGDVGYCKIVAGNRIVTVPKNYKTHRTIAIEPDMNMYVQKGIGSVMRKRLKAVGINLDDQTRNQRLAQVGSITGSLATIDLSMASDTISRVLVEKLIRPDWLEALEQSRSPFGVLPSGEKIFYQKFSSMGNGFTFELETVIFLSLALAWCHIHGEEVSRVSVYGDDIIIPSAVAESFLGLLTFCGFKANEKKSFWTGPFRESCGKHYSNGFEITPFYVRRVTSRLNDLFLLHNNLWRWFQRSKSVLSVAEVDHIEGMLRSLKRLAPAKWRRPRIPDGYGDGAFVGFFDEITPKLHPDGWECWVVNVLLEQSTVIYTDAPGLLPKALHNIYRRAKGSPPRIYEQQREEIEVHPSKVQGYRQVKMLIPQYALI